MDSSKNSTSDLEYPACPRCQGKWRRANVSNLMNRPIAIYDCPSCTMTYVVGNSLRLHNEIHHLQWDLQNKKCLYQKTNPEDFEKLRKNWNMNFIELPWLPFDISEEKLTTYVLFS